jgi:alpha-tubulin suppressor-like RCC1 family protein
MTFSLPLLQRLRLCAALLVLLFASVFPMARAAGLGDVVAGTDAALDAGEYHACSLYRTGQTMCWGNNLSGQNYPYSDLRFVAVSAGFDHSCGVQSDGELSCWGNASSLGTVPSGTFRAVSAGKSESCAIRSDGTLVCWGGNMAAAAPGTGRFRDVAVAQSRACAITDNGSLNCWQAAGVPSLGTTPTGAYLAVSVGTSHACALRTDGQALCWGSNTYGQTTVPGGARYAAVTVGYQHSCAIREDGTIACWGRNVSSQLAAPGGRFEAISAGRLHTCARAENGAVRCWGGLNEYAELNPLGEAYASHAVGGGQVCALDLAGHADCQGGSTELRPPQRRYVKLGLGEAIGCGLGSDHRPFCWGAPLGQIPTQPMESVSVGDVHVCGLSSDHRAVCWGGNADGQATPPDTRFTEIVSGDRFSCGLTLNDGNVVCWGQGPGATQATTASGLRFLSAHAGNACAVESSGRVRCWGDDAVIATPPFDAFGPVAVGARHVCGLRDYGSILCWGNNDAGQLAAPAGDGYEELAASGDLTCARKDAKILCWGAQTFEMDAPTLRTGNEALAAGRGHTCNLGSSGRLSCWGDNSVGQAGPAATPAIGADAYADRTCSLDGDGRLSCRGDDTAGGATPPSERVRDFGIGERNGCAVRTDGTLGCWGWNVNGQSTPQAGVYLKVATGLNHSCGIRDDGSLACWGYNAEGQATPPAGQYVSVDVGERHSCALGADGAARCWGLNSEGQSTPPDIAGAAYRALAVGGFHNCAIGAIGNVICWGRNDRGQATAPDEGSFVAITAGAAHTCAIRDDRTRVCWGDNDSAQAPVVQIDPAVLPTATIGEAYSVDLIMTGGGYRGVAPEFIGAGGNLPWGLWLNSSGQIYGTAQAEPGIYSFSVQAMDDNGFFARRNYQFTLVAPPDTTPPLIQPRYNGSFTYSEWFNRTVELEWAVTDAHSPVTSTSGCTTRTIDYDTDGVSFTCTATSAGGTSELTVVIRRDTVAPETVFTSTPPALSYGPVYHDATFTFESPGNDLSGLDGFECSSVAFDFFWPCNSPRLLTQLQWEVMHALYVRARDRAGNVDPTPALHQWIVRRDSTPPVVTPVITGTLGDNGWYRSDVQLRWSLQDPESQANVYAGCVDRDYTADTMEVYQACTARSWGGETWAFATIKRDATPPSIVAGVPAPNAAGWHRQNVAIGYTCTETTSGLTAPCPTGDVISQEGVGVSSSARTVRDNAGNTGMSNIVMVNLDKTPPFATRTPRTPPNAFGWHRQDVIVDFTCGDTLSGLATPCASQITVSSEGSNNPGETIYDHAGNSTFTGGMSVFLDKTAPTITALAIASPNAAGWYRNDVSVIFSCSDAVSGINGGCPATQILNQEGAAVTSVAQTVSDRAGNSATSNVVTVKIDKTPPILNVVMPTTVLLNATHDFQLNAIDAVSGIASQSCGPMMTNSVGTFSVGCSATDRAGNATIRTASYRVVYGYAPLSAPLSDPSQVFVVQAPRSVPFEWRLFDANGAAVTNAVLNQAALTDVPCPSTGVGLTTPPAGETNNYAHLGDGVYRRNWWINYTATGCLRLDITLNDGVTRSATIRVVPKVMRTGGNYPATRPPVPTSRAAPSQVQPARTTPARRAPANPRKPNLRPQKK